MARLLSTGDVGSNDDGVEIIAVGDHKIRIRSADGAVKSDYYTNAMCSNFGVLTENVRRKVKRGADMGTGRGVLAIAQGVTFRDAEVIGVDINPEAISLAVVNAENNSVAERVRFCLGEFMDPLTGEIDFVTSTLPTTVIPPQDGISKDMTFNQNAFLNGGSNGRMNVDRLIAAAPNHMPNGARLVVAISSFIGEDSVMQFMGEHGFAPAVAARIPKFLDETIHTRATAPYIESVLGYTFPEMDGRKYFTVTLITGDRDFGIK